jgi:hypothetical protein
MGTNFGQLFALLSLQDQFSGPIAAAAAAADAATLMIAGSMGRVQQAAAAAQTQFNNFSGDRIASQAQAVADAYDRVGGAAKLTEDEQARVNQVMQDFIDKSEALGTDVPPRFQAIADATKQAGSATETFGASFGVLTAAFSTGALLAQATIGMLDFAKAIPEAAGQLVDMSNKTGVSIEYLQQLRLAAELSGSTVDDFSSAVYKMGVNIGEGLPKTVKGLDDLAKATGDSSLAFDNLRNLAPEQEFRLIVEALGSMANQQMANAIGNEIFGRGFSTLAAAVHNGSLQMAADTNAASAEQVTAIKAEEDAWVRLKNSIENVLTGILGKIALSREEVQAVSAMANQMVARDPNLAYDQAFKAAQADYDAMKGHADDAAIAINSYANATRGVAAVNEDFVAELQAAHTAFAGLSPATLAQIDAAIKLGTSVKDLNSTFHLVPGEIELVKKALSEAEAATTAHAKAVADAAAAQQAYSDALMFLIPHEADIIADLVLHNMSQKDIAASLGVTEIQVHAVDEAMKANAATAKQNDADQKAALTDWVKMYTDWHNIFLAMNKTQQAEADKTARAQASAFLAAQDAIAKATLDLATLQENQSSSTYDVQVNNIRKWGTEQISALQRTLDKQGEWTDASYAQFDKYGNVIDQEVKAKIDALGPAWLAAASAITTSMGPIFSSLGSFGTSLDSVLKTSITDIGQVSKSLDQIGNKGESTVGNITGVLGAVSGVVGAVVSIGGAIASALGIGSTAGRDLIVSFAQTEGGFDSLHNKLLALGQEQTWIMLTQNVGSGDTTTAQAMIDKVKASLDGMSQSEQNLAALFGETPTQALAALNADITKYKVTIDQLGPAWQQQNLTVEAQGLLSSYENLIGAGVSVTNTIVDMSGVVKDAAGNVTGFSGGLDQLLNDAIRTGAALPDQFKPILQALIDSGDAVDATGQKITSLAGVQFSASLDEQFQQLIDKITQLVNALTKDLGPAITNLPGLPRGLDGSYAPPADGGLPSGASLSNAPIADVPMSAVVRSGYAYVKAGVDVVGAPALTPGGVGGSTASDSHLRALRDELKGLRQDQAAQAAMLPGQLSRAVRDAVLLAS